MSNTAHSITLFGQTRNPDGSPGGWMEIEVDLDLKDIARIERVRKTEGMDSKEVNKNEWQLTIHFNDNPSVSGFTRDNKDKDLISKWRKFKKG